MKTKLQQYKDIWYGSKYQGKIFIWIIADREDFSQATVYYFSSNSYRLDQCIDKFREIVYGEKISRDISRFRGYEK